MSGDRVVGQDRNAMEEAMECELSEDKATEDETHGHRLGEEFEKEVWVVYLPGRSVKPFDEWLDKNLPSKLSIGDGVDWISVRSEVDHDGCEEKDLFGLQDSWERLRKSGRMITFDTIKELAVNHGVRYGKWMFWAESGGKIDHLWSVVARSIVQGDLGHYCPSAKVSAYKPGGDGNHVVCIYNVDFTNMEQVLAAEKAIRNTGLKCKLLYKPDVYTYLGVYAKNEWAVRPIIFSSHFDISKGQSIFTDLTT